MLVFPYYREFLHGKHFSLQWLSESQCDLAMSTLAQLQEHTVSPLTKVEPVVQTLPEIDMAPIEMAFLARALDGSCSLKRRYTNSSSLLLCSVSTTVKEGRFSSIIRRFKKMYPVGIFL